MLAQGDPSESAPESAPLAAGLSDMALGGGGGVWRWREMEEDDENGNVVNCDNKMQDPWIQIKHTGDYRSQA